MSKNIQKYEVLYNHNTLLETRQFEKTIESIYTITMVPEKSGERCRCVGFYSRYSDVLHFIDRFGVNGLDEGGLFKYLIVEKVSEGIYATSDEFEETWFEADLKTNNWKEIKKPNQFKGVINFGIG